MRIKQTVLVAILVLIVSIASFAWNKDSRSLNKTSSSHKNRLNHKQSKLSESPVLNAGAGAEELYISHPKANTKAALWVFSISWETIAAAKSCQWFNVYQSKSQQPGKGMYEAIFINDDSKTVANFFKL